MPRFLDSHTSDHASATHILPQPDSSVRRRPYVLPPIQRFDSPFQSDNDSRSLHSIKSSKDQSHVRPPTAGGGPLSSHPTSEDDRDDYFPAVPGAYPTESSTSRHYNKPSNVMSSESNRDTSGSFIAPSSPPAQEMHVPGRRPSGVRRLFSLSSLRQSFSSSRTSFSIPPHSSYASHSEMQERPRTPGAMSFTASTDQSPSTYSSTNRASLRKKRSSNWFKRRSGFFAFNEDGVLDIVDEDSDQMRQAKRVKEAGRLPMLPEVSTLVELNEGSLGWDDQIFKK